MCGIVGYVGRRDACPILIKGLHRLEYRGYDSAGGALVNPDGRLNVFKCKGKVSDLEHFLDGKDLGGNIGIGDDGAVSQIVGFQRSPVGHLAFPREHARTVTYII